MNDSQQKRLNELKIKFNIPERTEASRILENAVPVTEGYERVTGNLSDEDLLELLEVFDENE